MAGTEQNDLIPQCGADFAVLKDPLNDIACLARFVRNSDNDEKGTFARCPLLPRRVQQRRRAEEMVSAERPQSGCEWRCRLGRR